MKNSFLSISLFSLIFLTACNFSGTEDKLPKKDLDATSAAFEETRLGLNIDPDILKAIEKDLILNPTMSTDQIFGLDTLRTSMRMLQHTYWVMKEADTLKEKLKVAGIDVIEDVIVPAREKGVDLWGHGYVAMSGGQGYVSIDKDKLVVVFRDTDSDDGWEKTLNMLTDARATTKKLSHIIEPGIGTAEKYKDIGVHEGFLSEYELFHDRVLEYVNKHPNKDIYVTGHSLGGALATLGSFDIAAHTGRHVTTFTFGGPRVGGAEFRAAFEELGIDMFRTVMDKDPVTRVPGFFIPYEHVGRLLQLHNTGDLFKPDEINTAILFEERDFTDHYKSTYYGGIISLFAICQEYPKECLKGKPLQLANAERTSQENFWDLIPLEKVNFPVDQIPIEKIPFTKLVDLKSRLSSLSAKMKAEPPWKKIPWDQVPKEMPSIPKDKIPWE